MRFERRGFGGRRSFGGPRMDRDDNTPKPVKVGEEYDVEISEVGSRGDGIARVSNFVVFVNGAKQGEKAHVKITEVRNRFAIGEKVGEGQKKSESEAASGEAVEEKSEGESESEEASSGETENVEEVEVEESESEEG